MATLTADLQIVEQVHEDLGVQLKQIATIIGADESTLHRWLSGTTPSGPRKVYRRRLAALQEFYVELRDAFSSLDAARRWLNESTPAGFGGLTPLQALLQGKIERVTGLLVNVNNGMLS
ncbi:MAG: antitoxin Xre/MbcA/ParS toxin-binding domain-containing protein [bacterium]